MNTETPETIYLIPGEYDGENGMVWCDDPAPSYADDPKEAVRYVRGDKVDEGLKQQAKIAHNAIDQAKRHASMMLDQAKKQRDESSPELIESERSANAALTEENRQLTAMVGRLREICEGRGEFIINGVEYGYIQLPDDDLKGIDTAHDTYQQCFEALPEAPAALQAMHDERNQAIQKAVRAARRSWVEQGDLPINQIRAEAVESVRQYASGRVDPDGLAEDYDAAIGMFQQLAWEGKV